VFDDPGPILRELASVVRAPNQPVGENAFCNAANPSHFGIRPHGVIVKCAHPLDLEENRIGHLSRDGSFVYERVVRRRSVVEMALPAILIRWLRTTEWSSLRRQRALARSPPGPRWQERALTKSPGHLAWQTGQNFCGDVLGEHRRPGPGGTAHRGEGARPLRDRILLSQGADPAI